MTTARSCPCGTTLGPKNVSGTCRPCTAARIFNDPANRARNREKICATIRSPAGRERRRQMALRRHAERGDDPTWQAYLTEQGKRLRAAYDADPAAQARNKANRAAAGRAHTERHLGWCPEERRDEYRRLRKMYGAAGARSLIEADLRQKAKAARHRAPGAPRLSFEEQQARVAAGAGLVGKPDLRRADPAFTLGGVASAAL
ncbi:hypothetical protein QH494_16050 [Sphingomonas sp. AR_OL41]|uniref:hypothetical protein n=1 Tax=Sphingomonas sp. AR_OL41 TaxID=3042729 RepID=UPI0024809EF3|nr:hypothetical protein [Sphingomonas sp. AR_OL41]MDH7973705.1 hypothetical protein [Sphingomonas sp. AR_OL41]